MMHVPARARVPAPGRILPYSAADTAAAADLIPYVDAACDGAADAEDFASAAAEAIDKAERRGAASPAVARLLREIFDVAA